MSVTVPCRHRFPPGTGGAPDNSPGAAPWKLPWPKPTLAEKGSRPAPKGVDEEPTKFCQMTLGQSQNLSLCAVIATAGATSDHTTSFVLIFTGFDGFGMTYRAGIIFLVTRIVAGSSKMAGLL
jgi:hypothetical protein